MSTTTGCSNGQLGEYVNCPSSTILQPTSLDDSNPTTILNGLWSTGISSNGGTNPNGRPGQEPTATGSTVAPERTTAVTGTTAPSHSSISDGTIAHTNPPLSVSSGRGSQGVAKGAVAGIAIATALIGAAIALVAAFLLFKRRKHTTNHPYNDDIPEYGSNLNMKNTPYVQVSQSAAPLPVAATSTALAKQDLDLVNLSNSSDFLAATLPPASEEHTIKTKVASLFSRFQRHVDSFYRDVHNTMTPTMATDLARFGSDLVEILESSPFPTVAVKHALAGYILSIVSPEADDQATLFPAEVTGLKENERSSDSDTQAAYILYKRLAVHLHSPNAASLQSRQADIREAAEHFALTFFPWANPTFHEQEKDEELVQIISDALDVNIWLYGEPYMYEFVWENTGRRGTVVAPGLVRLTDEKGMIMGTPRVLLEPTVMAS